MAILPNLDWKNEGEATSNSPRLDANRMQQLWDQARSAMTAPMIGNEQLITNGANCIQLNEKSILGIRSTGVYYCVNCTNTPTGNNGYLIVYAFNNDLCIIEFEDGGSSNARYRRKLQNGTWSDWSLVGGEALLTNTEMSVGGAGVTVPFMKAYGRLRVFIKGLGYADCIPTDSTATKYTGIGISSTAENTDILTTVTLGVTYSGSNGTIKLLKAKSVSYKGLANVEDATNKNITSIRGIV